MGDPSWSDGSLVASYSRVVESETPPDGSCSAEFSVLKHQKAFYRRDVWAVLVDGGGPRLFVASTFSCHARATHHHLLRGKVLTASLRCPSASVVLIESNAFQPSRSGMMAITARYRSMEANGQCMETGAEKSSRR